MQFLLTIEGCRQCGACCCNVADDSWLGGDEETDAHLRTGSGHCRYMLEGGWHDGKWTCAVWGTPEQPEFCQTYPYNGGPVEGCTATYKLERLARAAQPTKEVS